MHFHTWPTSGLWTCLRRPALGKATRQVTGCICTEGQGDFGGRNAKPHHRTTRTQPDSRMYLRDAAGGIPSSAPERGGLCTVRTMVTFYLTLHLHPSLFHFLTRLFGWLTITFLSPPSFHYYSNGMLPSFRGLSASVVYNISIVLMKAGSLPKHFVFPFAVCSRGSDRMPHDLKYITIP